MLEMIAPSCFRKTEMSINNIVKISFAVYLSFHCLLIWGFPSLNRRAFYSVAVFNSPEFSI